MRKAEVVADLVGDRLTEVEAQAAAAVLHVDHAAAAVLGVLVARALGFGRYAVDAARDDANQEHVDAAVRRAVRIPQVDGLVVAGDDLEPRRYGVAPHPADADVDRGVDPAHPLQRAVDPLHRRVVEDVGADQVQGHMVVLQQAHLRGHANIRGALGAMAEEVANDAETAREADAPRRCAQGLHARWPAIAR